MLLIKAVSIVVKWGLGNETVTCDTEIIAYQFGPEVYVIK